MGITRVVGGNHEPKNTDRFDQGTAETGDEMNPLLFPYIFNIIVLVPIGIVTLFGGDKGGQLACQGKFPESEGFRTILGSLWTAILIGSVVGLFFPLTMSALLLLQVIYKSLWLLVYVFPRILKNRSREVPWGIASTFLAIIVSYPWVIPWGQLFGSLPLSAGT